MLAVGLLDVLVLVALAVLDDFFVLVGILVLVQGFWELVLVQHFEGHFFVVRIFVSQSGSSSSSFVDASFARFNPEASSEPS
jgi:hypothetical protein